jgi:hypothetical protein
MSNDNSRGKDEPKVDPKGFAQFVIDKSAPEEERILSVVEGVMQVVSGLVKHADVDQCATTMTLIGALLSHAKNNDHAGCAARVCVEYLIADGVGKVVSVPASSLDPDAPVDLSNVMPFPAAKKPTEH